MAETKGKRGAPDAETRKKNRLARLEKDWHEATLKGKETAVANYLEYVEVLDKAARGELKGVTPTNQISSAKVMKDWVEKMLDEENQEQGEVVSEESTKEKEQPVPMRLISLEAKEA